MLLFIIAKLTLKPKYILLLLFSITISTLLFSQYATTLFTSSSYYLLPTRFFELAIGGLLAIYPQKKLNNTFFLFNIQKTIGLLLVFYSFFTFNAQTNFPGINALIPCLGACLIISSDNYGNPSLLLSTRLLQYIGLLSYSMYLWHWPIIAYLNYLYVPIDLMVSILILISTIILSYLTWKYIETPFRQTGNKKVSAPFLPNDLLYL